MTAPGPLRPTPGSAAFAGRPVGALWVLLLIGFLIGLPCSGSAHAAAPTGPPQSEHVARTVRHATTTAVHRTAGTAAEHHATHAQPRGARPFSVAAAPVAPVVLCTADDPAPQPGDGCSSHHPFSTQDAQLPNAPPHPVPTALPQLVTARALPLARPAGHAPGTATAPDLHLLQVNRT